MSSGLTHEFRWVQEWVNASGANNLSIEEKMREVLYRRKRGEPLAYIFGEWPFCGLNLKVGPGVLVPRPETEELADVVVKNFIKDSGNFRILDLGSGSGCLGLGVSNLILHRFPDAKVELILVEKSPHARVFLEQNIQEFVKNFTSRVKVELIFDDWNFLVSWKSKKIDLLLSNPPYISETEYLDLDESVKEFEPIESLVPFVRDPSGIACYEEIFSLCHGQHRAIDAHIVAVEMGHNQGRDVRRLGDFYLPHFDKREVLKDMCGKDRFFLAYSKNGGR